MTDIAFHTGIADPLDYACRLLRKAYRSGARAAVYGEPGLLDPHALMWSPDGRRLAFMDYAPSGGVRLHTLTFSSADPAVQSSVP